MQICHSSGSVGVHSFYNYVWPLQLSSFTSGCPQKVKKVYCAHTNQFPVIVDLFFELFAHTWVILESSTAAIQSAIAVAHSLLPQCHFLAPPRAPHNQEALSLQLPIWTTRHSNTTKACLLQYNTLQLLQMQLQMSDDGCNSRAKEETNVIFWWQARGS